MDENPSRRFVLHTDKGEQFIDDEFIKLFEQNSTKVSVGERSFRRTYKWEFAYLRDKFDTLAELRGATKLWFRYYNERRHH